MFHKFRIYLRIVCSILSPKHFVETTDRRAKLGFSVRGAGGDKARWERVQVFTLVSQLLLEWLWVVSGWYRLLLLLIPYYYPTDLHRVLRPKNKTLNKNTTLKVIPARRREKWCGEANPFHISWLELSWRVSPRGYTAKNYKHLEFTKMLNISLIL